jgi:drug/metabolite transporter (DMT)-like permease
MRPKPNPLAVWAGLITLYLVWGSTYLGMKVAIDSMPPFVMGVFRFIPAGVILTLLVVVRSRGAIRRPSPRQVVDAAIVGLLLLVGGTGFVAWAEQTIPTGVAAVMIALVPMWLAVLGFVFYREPVRPLLALGIAIGIVGVGILAWPAGGAGELDPLGLAVILVAPVSWALGTLYAAKRAVLPGPALLASGIEMTAAGLGFIVVAAVTGEWASFDITAVTPSSWAGIGYLIVMGSLVGYTTFAWLITVASLARVSTYAYVNPVVAVILGFVVLGEPLTMRTLVASVVIVAAVAIIVTARARPTSAPAETHAPAPARLASTAPADEAPVPALAPGAPEVSSAG